MECLTACSADGLSCINRRILAKDEVPEKAEEDIEASEPEDKPILVVEPQAPSDKPSDMPILVDEVVPQTEAEGKDAEGKDADDTDKDAAGAAAAEKDAVLQAAAQMDLESGRGDEGEQFEDPPRDITGIGHAFDESQMLEPPVVGTAVRIAEVTPVPEAQGSCSAACLACCNQSTSANVSEKQVAKMVQAAT